MARNEPATFERSLPVTRFKVAPEPLSKVTWFLGPMEKLFQSMMPVVLDCLTVSEALALLIEPRPDEKCPPPGSAPARAATGVTNAMDNAAALVTEFSNNPRNVTIFASNVLRERTVIQIWNSNTALSFKHLISREGGVDGPNV